MIKISRRALAKYAADQLITGKPAHNVAKQLAGVLVTSGRTAQWQFLLGDIKWEMEKRGELANVQVAAAHPVPQALEKALRIQIKKALKVKEILVEQEIDASIIGGLRIETPSRVWDFSVKRKLAELKETF